MQKQPEQLTYAQRMALAKATPALMEAARAKPITTPNFTGAKPTPKEYKK
ncbi:MAG: hypothetical protein ACYCOY_02100 [Metallibacterium sp.]